MNGTWVPRVSIFVRKSSGISLCFFHHCCSYLITWPRTTIPRNLWVCPSVYVQMHFSCVQKWEDVRETGCFRLALFGLSFSQKVYIQWTWIEAFWALWWLLIHTPCVWGVGSGWDLRACVKSINHQPSVSVAWHLTTSPLLGHNFRSGILLTTLLPQEHIQPIHMLADWL